MPVERFDQPLQLGRARITLALGLLVALNPLGRVVRAHLPADREREHLRHHRHHAVGLRGAAGPGDLAMEGVDVAPGHLGDLHASQGWPDVALNRAAVAVRGMRPFAADVLLETPLDQVIDDRRPALGRDLGQRIAALVDLPLEPARLLASAGDGPIGEAADGVAALPPRPVPIGDDEGAVPGGGDPDAKPRQRWVVGDAVAL